MSLALQILRTEKRIRNTFHFHFHLLCIYVQEIGRLQIILCKVCWGRRGGGDGGGGGGGVDIMYLHTTKNISRRRRNRRETKEDRERQ